MRLRACMLAIAVLTPLRAFAQTPAPAEAAPPPGAPPPAAPEAMPPAEAAPPMAAPMAPPPVEVVPAPAAATPTPRLTWGGLVDTYYLFDFTRPDGSNTLIPPVARAFDTNSNSATLAYAKVSLNAALDPVSFQLDMGYGSTGTIINSTNNGDAMAPSFAPPIGGSFIIQQAYGTLNLPGNFSLDFGKFVTTAGAEVIEANKNWLYSRSFLFNIIPFVHTGARANLKVNDQLTLQASLVNGWNNDPDNNAWKTIGLSASITASPMVSIVATTYFGKEGTQGAAADTPNDLRFLADIVAAFTINDKFGLNLNIDYVKAWDDVAGDYLVGGSLMGRYVISDHVNVAARGEFLRSHNDVASANQDIMEGTLMVGFPMGSNFELRPELRYDHVGQDTMALNASNNQFTGTLAALTYF